MRQVGVTLLSRCAGARAPRRLGLARPGALLGDGDSKAETLAPSKLRSLPYWADPAQAQAGEINHHDGGRGFYFEDPDRHFLEIITRPYGSGGHDNGASGP